MSCRVPFAGHVQEKQNSIELISRLVVIEGVGERKRVGDCLLEAEYLGEMKAEGMAVLWCERDQWHTIPTVQC